MIENQKVSLKKLLLVHGDFETQQVFSKYLNANGFPDVDIPALGDVLKINADNSTTWLDLTPQYDASKKASDEGAKPESEI